MTQPIHPFLREYHRINLECGSLSEPHFCDAMKFYTLKELNCPSCSTPFTTSGGWRGKLQILQGALRLLMPQYLQSFSVEQTLFSLQQQLIQEGQPIPENRIQTIPSDPINKLIDEVDDYLDSFPFRDVPGLEFLARESLNNENRQKYGYTVPSEGTRQVLEEFISENNFQKEEVRIIDYGAGTALWSRFFLENGFEALAVDCKRTRAMYAPPKVSFLRDVERKIHYVGELECGLPEDCSQQILFLCWPEDPAQTDYPMYAGRVLKEFRERNGTLAVYVGKGRGGNTASPAFFDEMEENWEFTIVDKNKKATWRTSDMYLLKKK